MMLGEMNAALPFQQCHKESVLCAWPYVGSRVVRIDLLCFLAGCRKRRLNQDLSVLSLSLGFF